jgi:ankyrin repeat protein
MDDEAKRARKRGGLFSWKQKDLSDIRNGEASFLLTVLLDTQQAQDYEDSEHNSGPNAMMRDFEGRTPLHYAVKAGNALACHLLVAIWPWMLGKVYHTTH